MPTGTEGNTPHLPFPAAAAAQLLELLSTDDAYRSLFASDKAAALKQLGLSDDFIAQVHQALRNVAAVLQAAGAGPEHMVRMTWYVLDRDEYNRRLKELGGVYRDVMGRHFPAMSCVQVAGLMEARAKVEIEVTAVIPD